jgi:hypothetical protein
LQVRVGGWWRAKIHSCGWGEELRSDRVRVTQLIVFIFLAGYWAFRWAFCFGSLIRSTCTRGEVARNGDRDYVTIPAPPSPTGRSFLPYRSPWGLVLSHPHPLIGEFPVGNRGTGPCCHLCRGGGNECTGIHATDADVSVYQLRAEKASGFALRQMLQARPTPNRLTHSTSTSENWLTRPRLSRLVQVYH